MRIVIAGGSGLLGTALTHAFVNDRDTVTILPRSAKKDAPTLTHGLRTATSVPGPIRSKARMP
jgi:NAD dependent epimerase/dehydratase family enzyme